jgi:DNA-binding PadR family transcriptional regulator
MARNRRSNPLALTVLCLLYERPMHPYEMAQTLRERAKQESIRLNFGSLYGVVQSLERRKLLRAVETVREGRRPPRTIYEITDRGKAELHEWLSDLVAVPVKEYLQFEAALSLLHALPPEEALRLLRLRCDALQVRLAQMDGTFAMTKAMGLPRLFELESEYQEALVQAELAWTRQLVDDIESDQLEGLDFWRRWHAGERPELDIKTPDEVDAERRASNRTDRSTQPTETRSRGRSN